jgi:hypothetical protein
MANSVVDYDAWKRGYMPPTEHVLIDELSYRGAKVVSASVGSDFGWWLVVKGDMDRKKLAHISKSIYIMMEIFDDDDAAKADEEQKPTET